MYLISRSASLTLPLRDRKVEYHPATGEVVKVHQALSVQFQHAGYVPPYAMEAVKQLPNWGNGLGHNEDPFTRCGALDTDVEAVRQGWTPEEKQYIEAALLRGTSNGVEYVIANAPKAAKPWPKYDEIVGAEAATQIAWQVDQLGLDPKAVRQYENENAAREDVVTALEALVSQEDEDVVGVISA